MKSGIITAALAALTAWASVTAAQAQSSGSEPRFKPRGRIQYDVQSRDWDVLDEDAGDSYIRRAFLGAQGRLTPHWRYKLDVIVTPADDRIGVDDGYLEYHRGNWSVFFGEHNVTSPLEDRISSLDIPFIERSSVINAFGYGRAAGLAFLIGGDNWSFSTAAQLDSLNNTDDNDIDERRALSGRLTFAPVLNAAPERARLVHLGFSVRARELDEQARGRYRARPLNGRDTRWIDAGGGLAGAEDIGAAAELALQHGPLGLQAEYHVLEGETAAGAEFDYSGYYVDLYWSITGEPRAYRANQGAFRAISPRRPFGEGGWGHWMASARYDFIDLSDPAGGAARGEQSAYAVGLDWVPVDHVRLKLNYAVSEMDRTLGPDDEAEIVTLRAQLDF